MAGEVQLADGQAHNALLPRLLIIVALGIPLALTMLAASPLGLNIIYVEYGIPALLFVL
jgi:hypothetical protein